jgi:ApeA N-terminal domain 1
MAQQNFIKVSIKIPELSKKWFPGRLYTKEIKVEFESKGKSAFFLETIECIYAKSNTGEKYSLVGCFPISMAQGVYTYSVNELHFNDWINLNSPVLVCESDFEISYLGSWFLPLTNSVYNESSDIWKSINIGKSISMTFPISKNASLIIYNSATTEYSGRKITIETTAHFKIKTKKSLPKYVLYKHSTSFINFFSIFISSKVFVHKMEFRSVKGNSYEVLTNFFNKPHSFERSEIQVSFKELESCFLEILQNYFSNQEKFDRIIKLIRDLSFTNEDQSFLTLCRCLESYHKDFIEPKCSDSIIKSLTNELLENGVKLKQGKKWVQIIRYWHLLKILKPYQLKQHYSKNEYDFIEKLKNTRNHYTHPDDITEGIWSFDELKRINFQLKIWIKGLILQELNLREELIKQVLNKESKNYLFLNSQSNKYSLFYEPPTKNKE